MCFLIVSIERGKSSEGRLVQSLAIHILEVMSVGGESVHRLWFVMVA